MLSRIVPTLLAVCLATAAVAQPQRDPDFVPLGVYLAVDDMFNLYPVPDTWAWIDAALVDMEAHHINTVWLVNTNAAFMAEFARRAEPHGIYLVACPAEINARYALGDTPAQWASRIQSLLATWGDAPKPAAWGIYDEPGFLEADAIEGIVDVWEQTAPGEPVTLVTFGPGTVTSYKDIGLNAYCADFYVVWPDRTAANIASDWQSWSTYMIDNIGISTKPWYMGQAFQSPQEPFTANAEGNIVYQPGGGPHWNMPTPELIRWQAWASFAYGNVGFFHFIYAYRPANLGGGPPRETWANEHDSGAPVGLVSYPDRNPTAQYEAMGAAFAKLGAIGPLWHHLDPEPAIPDVEVSGNTGPGALTRHFSHDQTGAHYIAIVASFDAGSLVNVTVSLPSDETVRDVATGITHVASVSAESAAVALAIAPGDGVLLELVPNGDRDGDGLAEWEEDELGTDPTLWDTDGDGASDGAEVAAATDPLDEDTDDDGVYDGVEIALGTDPLDDEDTPSVPALSVPFFLTN